MTSSISQKQKAVFELKHLCVNLIYETTCNLLAVLKQSKLFLPWSTFSFFNLQFFTAPEMNVNSGKTWLRISAGLPRSPPSNSFSSLVRLEKMRERERDTYLNKPGSQSPSRSQAWELASVSKTHWKVVTTFLAINIHQRSQIASGNRWRSVDPQ